MACKMARWKTLAHLVRRFKISQIYQHFGMKSLKNSDLKDFSKLNLKNLGVLFFRHLDMHRLLLIVLLISVFAVQSQERLWFEEINIDDGLSQSSILCMVQD